MMNPLKRKWSGYDLGRRETGGLNNMSNLTLSIPRARQEAMRQAVHEVFGDLITVSEYDDGRGDQNTCVILRYNGSLQLEPMNTYVVLKWNADYTMSIWIESPGEAAIKFAQQKERENRTDFAFHRVTNDDIEDNSMYLTCVDTKAATATTWKSRFFRV